LGWFFVSELGMVAGWLLKATEIYQNLLKTIEIYQKLPKNTGKYGKIPDKLIWCFSLN